MTLLSVKEALAKLRGLGLEGPEDGQPIVSFGERGAVDLTQGLRRDVEPNVYSISSPPLLVNDVIVVGSSITDAKPTQQRAPGDVRGFDVRTGEELWVFHSIPQPGEYGHETWEDGSWEYTGNTNVWTIMSADEELGYVYLPFSTPTDDWYGGHRPGDNLFAESLVLSRRAHRRARLAFPDRAPRGLGLRLARGAEPRRYRSGRPLHQSGGPDHEARFRLCLRPSDR